MLPGSIPAIANVAAAYGRVLAVPLFVGSYLAVWTLVGLGVYTLDQPHGT